MNLRDDIICEKTRSTKEIRKRLAELLRIERGVKNASLSSQQWRASAIFVLKWILQHDTSPKEWYQKQYGREWPG